MDASETADLLNDLLALGEDVIVACQQASTKLKETELELALADLENKHSAAVGAFRREVQALGEEPRESGTLKGAADRIINEAMNVLTEAELPAHVNEVLKQHERWLAGAREVIIEGIPPDVKNTVNAHYEATSQPAAKLDHLLRGLN